VSESSEAKEPWRIIRVDVQPHVTDGRADPLSGRLEAVERYDVSLVMSQDGNGYEWTALKSHWPDVKRGSLTPPTLIVLNTTLEEIKQQLPQIDSWLLAAAREGEEAKQEAIRAKAEEQRQVEITLANRKAFLDELNRGLS
jgi:hypothetical protein